MNNLSVVTALLVLLAHFYQQSDAASWDSYIDSLIAQSKDDSGNPQIDKAAIIALDGGAPWTSAGNTNSLRLSNREAANIASSFKRKDFTTGVIANGVKYNFLREEGGKVVYAKKEGEGALTLQASETAIIIVHIPEGSQPENANKAVAVIAEYFEILGL